MRKVDNHPFSIVTTTLKSSRFTCLIFGINIYKSDFSMRQDKNTSILKDSFQQNIYIYIYSPCKYILSLRLYITNTISL